jgi:uncharacterized lipoprotein YehR (DUF1307 family)
MIMKKLIATVLCLVLVLSMVGCGGKQEEKREICGGLKSEH